MDQEKLETNVMDVDWDEMDVARNNTSVVVEASVVY